MNLKSHASAKEQVAKDVLGELEKSPDSMEIETGVHKFVEWVRSSKLEIKAHPTENLHAKLYIMTFAEGDRDKGRVITGSSNMTQSGLQDNLEFNVELKNRADYDFAIAKFNELWATAVDVSKPYEDAIVNRSPFAHFTPLELYLKFLYEYFRDELNRPDELEDIYVPAGFKRLKYQEEAVLSAKKVLEEYGGLFLSDVVGLGKTYMAALLAQQLDGRSLVIAPPHLLDKHNPGSWPNVFGDFRVPHTDFESIGKLEDVLERDVSKYANVFIDEFHKGHVYISKEHINKIFDLLETDDQEGIDRLLEAEKAERLDAKDFNADYIRDLEGDRKILRRVAELWKRVKRDPKWEAFREVLRGEPKLKKSKLIIFTESRETAEYLAERIKNDVERNILLFTGDSEESVRREVISNFDARAFQPKDQYRSPLRCSPSMPGSDMPVQNPCSSGTTGCHRRQNGSPSPRRRPALITARPRAARSLPTAGTESRHYRLQGL